MPELVRIRRYGVLMCPCMIATLPMIEGRLRAAGLIKHDLSGLIFQGCWNSGVAASAGTHDGGGAIDVYPSLATSAGLRAWRESGVAMWHRAPIAGLWGEHAHGVWEGCPHLSAGAAAQITMYRQGYNGLASWGRDTGPRIVTTWQAALTSWQHELHPDTPLTEPDYLQEVMNMDPSEYEKRTERAVRHGTYAALVDFVKADNIFPSPMPNGPDRKKNEYWALTSIVRYWASWGRISAGKLNTLAAFFTKGAAK